MFDEINCMQNLKELKKELKKLKEDKTRGQNDLEKTIDVLKTDNSIAEWHIIKLKNEIKELKGKLNDEGKIKIT